MEDNKPEVETVYTVTVYTDGTFSASLEQPDAPIEAKRQATVYDVLSISGALVKEIESAQMTDRIVVSILQVMRASVPPTTADTVKDALKERGIDPESPAPTA
jgi:hypothetical protein